MGGASGTGWVWDLGEWRSLDLRVLLGPWLLLLLKDPHCCPLGLDSCLDLRLPFVPLCFSVSASLFPPQCLSPVWVLSLSSRLPLLCSASLSSTSISFLPSLPLYKYKYIISLYTHTHTHTQSLDFSLYLSLSPSFSPSCLSGPFSMSLCHSPCLSVSVPEPQLTPASALSLFSPRSLTTR